MIDQVSASALKILAGVLRDWQKGLGCRREKLARFGSKLARKRHRVSMLVGGSWGRLKTYLRKLVIGRTINFG